jgi:outer membrane protein assembly factor BamB
MTPTRQLSLAASLLIAVFTPGPMSAAPGDIAPGWPVQTYGVIFGAPAIGPHGEIVVATSDWTETSVNRVYSYNPNGSLRWIFEGAGDWIDSSPTIASDGTVYVGCWDNFLYALDGDTGSMNWRFETGSLITASAAIGPDGTIYIGSYDGLMYALHPDGSLKWSFSAGSSLSPINGGATLNHAGDTLYFGTNDGDLYALNTVNGAVRWSYSIPDTFTERAIYSAPAIGIDGSIYFGSENKRVYALSASGSFKWLFPSTGAVLSSPIADGNGTVYITSQDGYLYAVDSVGFQLWEIFVGDVFYCTPAMDAAGNIIVAGYAGSSSAGAATSFASISPSGTLQWEYLIDGVNDSSPNIAPDGSIYIGAHDGFLYKLEGVAPLSAEAWPRTQANRRQTGWSGELEVMELVDHFPAISVVQSGWVHVPWFGIGWLTGTDLPWIQHLDHGFIFIGNSGTWGCSFYDTGLGEWLYSPAIAPNYYFRYTTDTWLYHWQGTNVSSGRWFFDYSLGAWMPDTGLN